MNILQFWLIDSIVKASTVIPLRLGLDEESRDRADREPLFGIASDDEGDDDDDDDDDGESGKPGDVENQRLKRQHHNRSYSDERTSGDDGWSPSGSDSHLDAHSYPPPNSGGSETSSFQGQDQGNGRQPRPAMRLMKKARKRSPPHPLNLRYVNMPPITSPLITTSLPTAAPTPAPRTAPNARSQSSKATAQSQKKNAPAEKWAESWGEEGDWAERVGEEEWTGRRLEETRDAVDSTWQASPARLGV